MTTSQRKAIFTLTQAAADRVQSLLSKRDKPSLGIRIGTRAKGCNGQSYTLEIADHHQIGDEILQTHGISIFIDPKALIYVIGTEMDFIDDKLQSGFIFRNPNEKGRCGCGESFHV